MTDMTPQVLRDVADWLDDGNHGVCTAGTFREEADRLEREQADEERIDELARIAWDARLAESKKVFGENRFQDLAWLTIEAKFKEVERAGIRAVLAEYDPEGRLTAPEPYDNGGPAVRPLRQWDHLHDIPKDVQKVRNGDGRECVREQLVWKVIHPDDGRPIIPRWHSRGPFTEIPTIEEPNA